MEEEKPLKRQTTKFSRAARNRRIVERLREGLNYHEIAREERLTGQRVRQIVQEALEGREALESAVHAQMQVDRVARAVQVAGQALAQGDVRAVAPFLKAVEKLDRYQALARETAPRQPQLVKSTSLVISELVRRFRPDILEECRREAMAELAAKAAAASAPAASAEAPVIPPPDPGEAPAAAGPPPAAELAPALAASEADAAAAVAPPPAPELQPTPPPSAPKRFRMKAFANGVGWEPIPD